MQRPTTVDHTIVVRAWIEPQDPTPRARLVAVGLDREITAYGSTEIELAFSRLLRALVEPDDRSDAV